MVSYAEAKLRPVMIELAYNLESFNPAFTAVMLKVTSCQADLGCVLHNNSTLKPKDNLVAPPLFPSSTSTTGLDALGSCMKLAMFCSSRELPDASMTTESPFLEQDWLTCSSISCCTVAAPSECEVRRRSGFRAASYEVTYVTCVQIQSSIGHSDYVKRDQALKGLIQPLAGEYGMHNGEAQGQQPLALLGCPPPAPPTPSSLNHASLPLTSKCPVSVACLCCTASM